MKIHFRFIYIAILIIFISACSPEKPLDPRPTSIEPEPTETQDNRSVSTPEVTGTSIHITQTPESYVFIGFSLQQIFDLRETCKNEPLFLFEFKLDGEKPASLMDYAPLAPDCMVDYVNGKLGYSFSPTYAAVLAAANLIRAQHINWGNTELTYVPEIANPEKRLLALPFRLDAAKPAYLEIEGPISWSTVPVLFAPEGETLPQPTVLEHIKFMVWNVEWGGGAHQACRTSENDRTDNFLPNIIEVVKAIDPDILAVNEACHWNDLGSGEDDLRFFGNEIVKDYFSRTAGFSNCFIGKVYYDLESHDVVSGVCYGANGYKSFETESLDFTQIRPSENISNGVRVKVQTPMGFEIIVYSIHLIGSFNKPAWPDIQQQAQWISKLVAKDITDGYRVIVAGDHNILYEYVGPFYRASGLSPLPYLDNGIWNYWMNIIHGWQQSPIDHIWISPGLAFESQDDAGIIEDLESVKHLIGRVEGHNEYLTSDHPPEAIGIFITPIEN
jgi:endonuclease/exonuclease/phosphatase family metal-dependent hydrolase